MVGLVSTGVPNGFGRTSAPVTGGPLSSTMPFACESKPVVFFGDKDRLVFAGLTLRALEWGGICLGGDSGIVGFRIDLMMGGKIDYTEGNNQFMTCSSCQRNYTFRRFPASSFSASNPPGPMLLLRFFFGSALVSVIDDIVEMLPKVIFSFSMLMSREGWCAIDLCAPCRVCTALGDCDAAILNFRRRVMSSNSRLFSFGVFFNPFPALTTWKGAYFEYVVAAVIDHILACLDASTKLI